MTLTDLLTKLRASAAVREALSADSLEGRADKLREAWNSIAPSYDWYVCDVFDDSIIVRNSGTEYRRVPYTIAGDVVTFGEPTAVEVTFADVREALVRESAELTKPLDMTGSKWDARILRFGLSKNGWLWTRESAESLLPLLKGAPVCLYPHGQHAPEATILANGGPVKEAIVGQVDDPRIEADGVYGTVHIAEAHAPIRARLLELAKRGGAVAAGLSVDTLCSYVPVKVREGIAKAIQVVKHLISVDIVNAPSADGGLIRATAGPVLNPQEDTMKREELIALVRESRPQLLEGKDVEKISDADLAALVREALKTPAAPKVDPKSDEKPAWFKEYEDARGIERAVEATQRRVKEAVEATRLPAIVQAKVIKAFVGRSAEAAVIEAAVKEEVDTMAALYPNGDPKGFGAGRVEITAAPLDKVQAAMDRLFGVEVKGFDRAMESAPFLQDVTLARIRESMKPAYEAGKDPGLAFRSLRHAYAVITGDEDVSGLIKRGRASEAIENSTWADILGNTLYRRMLMDYAEPQFNERSIAEYGRAEDFRTKEVTILNYFGDIADVDPESADYQEIAAPGDDKVTYSVGQKGNILTITRKVIINDDLRAVAKLVGRLGRAARRTLAKAIWQTNWVSNVAYGVDSVAWFHSNHGNTASTALTADATGAAAVLTAITAMINMTEPGSLEKLGMPPMESLWLDVPPALFGIARRLNLTGYFGTTETNPVQGFFGPNGERINVNTLFTDTTDWGVHVSPGAGGRESLLVDFLQGREEPEFFLADQPTVGQAFYGDKIQYKLRHEYGVVLADVRGAVKNVVTGA